MVNQTRVHSKSNDKPHATFNLYKDTGPHTTLICCNISTSQASVLLNDLSGSYRLKFIRMEA